MTFATEVSLHEGMQITFKKTDKDECGESNAVLLKINKGISTYLSMFSHAIALFSTNQKRKNDQFLG